MSYIAKLSFSFLKVKYLINSYTAFKLLGIELKFTKVIHTHTCSLSMSKP